MKQSGKAKKRLKERTDYFDNYEGREGRQAPHHTPEGDLTADGQHSRHVWVRLPHGKLACYVRPGSLKRKF
jgi:hypothetical protein